MNAPNLRFKDENGKDYPEWKSQKLRDFSEIKTGPFGSLLHAGDYISDGHPIITTEHFKNGYLPDIKFNIPQVSDKSYNELNPYILNENDIVFSRVGSVDINALVTKNQAGWLFSGRVLRVRTKGHNQNFVHYALTTKHVRKNILSRAVGQTMPSINTEILSDTVINLPSNIDEEKKISDFFFELDRLIQITTKKLKSLEQIKKGFLQKIFSQELTVHNFHGQWKQRYLFDCISKITDFRGRTPKKLGMEWSKEGYIALSANNVKNGYIDFSKDVHYGDDSLYKMWMTGNELHKGQVLFTTEAPMGNVAQIPDDKKYILSQRTIAFSVKKNVISEDFLALVLRSPYVKNKLYTLQSGGTAKGVSQKTLSSLKIRIPENLDDQNKLAGLFANFDKLITDQHRKIRLYEQIKKALLQQMFI